MRAWTVIQSKPEYTSALKRIEELSQNPPKVNSDEGKELMLLGYLIDQYEEEQFPIKYPSPIDAIKARMEDLDITINDLLPIFGDRGTASKVLSGQRSLSLNMIRGLSEQLSLPVSLLIQPIKTKRKKLEITVAEEPKVKYRRKKES